jgi:SOS-response transcriptional repressor LexA
MNETQRRILDLAKTVDIYSLGVRELARQLGVHPQTAKYHKERLEQAGKLKGSGFFADVAVQPAALGGGADLVTLPFLGSASCGPASEIARAEPEGKITLSSRLLKTRHYQSLFAIKAHGISMNKASISGKPIEDGDYVIVDTSKQATPGDYVVAIVNGLANIKRYYPQTDETGNAIGVALISESTDDFEPIFIHPEDDEDGLIAGIALQTIKRPHVELVQ